MSLNPSSVEPGSPRPEKLPVRKLPASYTWTTLTVAISDGTTWRSARPVPMRAQEAKLLELSRGIPLRGFEILIPWLVSRSELFEILPEEHFLFPYGRHWPLLRFKLLGYTADWGFNFMDDDQSRLTELQIRNDRSHSPKRTYRRSAAKFHEALGRPNLVDHGRTGQQTWRSGHLWIDNWLVRESRMSTSEVIVPVHTLSIRTDVHLPQR